MKIVNKPMAKIHLTYLPLLLIFALLPSCIEQEISAPSLPDIMQQLHASATMVGFTISYNFAGFSLGALIYGPLSECYGRRRMMVIGTAILSIGAIACVVAPSINWLLAARFIQGIGAATAAVLVSTIVSDVYSTKKAAKLYGMMNAVFTTLMAMAPVFGGLINDAIGWRGNFGVVAITCVLSWLLVLRFLPETKPQRDKFKLKNTIADFKALLSAPLFLSAAMVPNLLYGCYISFVAIAPFLYMQIFRLDILTYTFHQGAVVATFAVTSILAARIIDFLGVRRGIWLALSLVAIGAGLMPFAFSAYTLTATMSIFCIGFALMVPMIFTISMEMFPAIRGAASSTIICLRYLACAVLTGLASWFNDGKIISLALLLLVTTFVTCMLIIYLLAKVIENEN
jgi:DHA1 family bicyclomycin/chloramphenicol resistance-like MFS transporter